MTSKTVTRHYCDHCHKGKFRKPDMVKHEAVCYRNMHRSCFRCGIGESDVEANAKAMIEGGMRALELVTDYCPDCILAAVMVVNKSASTNPEDGEWIQYDYKAARLEWDKSHHEEWVQQIGLVGI